MGLGSLEDSPNDKVENCSNSGDRDIEEENSKSNLRDQVILEEIEDDNSEEELGETSREENPRQICIEDRESFVSSSNNLDADTEQVFGIDAAMDQESTKGESGVGDVGANEGDNGEGDGVVREEEKTTSEERRFSV